MALVEAARFLNAAEASIARGMLEAEEIPAILFDAQSHFTGGDLGWVQVRLMVHEDDLSRARRLLAEANASGA